MKSLIQEIENALNAASEVFLMVAIISLLALPFAVAANLSPIVKPTNLASNQSMSHSVLGLQDTSTNTNVIGNSASRAIIVDTRSTSYAITKEGDVYRVTLIDNTTNPILKVINSTNHSSSFSIHLTSTGISNTYMKVNDVSYDLKNSKSVDVLANSNSSISVLTDQHSLPLTLGFTIDIK